MIYSRKIEVFKCHYAHFAHIRLPFGCTDEKMDFHLYSNTYGNFSKFAKIRNLKIENVKQMIRFRDSVTKSGPPECGIRSVSLRQYDYFLYFLNG